MTNADILAIAMAQSAIDCGCEPKDFLKSENVLVTSKDHPDARKYLKLPFSCDLVSYGTNIVASVSPEYREIVWDYINRFPVEHCFETPNLHVLNDAMERTGNRICFMAEYFLPDLNLLNAPDCDYELRILTPEDFRDLYLPQWSNALCTDRKHLDVLGVGAYDRDQLVGFAACSADCDTMWQIGVDVLPQYRRRGIASTVTGRLAMEILARGKVPLYCAAWSNIKSVRNALRCGFRPAWVELTVKPIEFVNKMNSK